MRRKNDNLPLFVSLNSNITSDAVMSMFEMKKVSKRANWEKVVYRLISVKHSMAHGCRQRTVVHQVVRYYVTRECASCGIL